jgi:hypothetical protein
MRVCRLMWLVLLVTMPFPAMADVPPRDSREFREPQGSEGQLRTLTIAMYLLIALTIGTVSLMLVLMLWGSRVRREARKPLPATKPNDPLWYLKTKKKTAGEPEGQPNVSEEKDPPETESNELL